MLGRSTMMPVSIGLSAHAVHLSPLAGRGSAPPMRQQLWFELIVL
jgi:hypothetical protein